MGCDHLVCKRCQIGYNLERGSAFFVRNFIRDHWHARKGVPSSGTYFPISHKELPTHLVVRHRMMEGFISIREPVCCHYKIYNGDTCMHSLCIEREIQNRGKWYTRFVKVKWYLSTILAALKGETLQEWEEQHPYRLSRKKHDWMVT